MAIRLTPEQMLKTLFVALMLIWALLWATGCAAATVDEMPITGVAVETASPTTTAGDDAVITNINVGTGAGCMVLVGLLGLLAWRLRTATGAVDRVVQAIETRDYGGDKDALKRLKETIALDGGIITPDRPERLIRSRLARRK